ncbi:MAG: alpha-1,2-fucosyltransferase [Blautia sp.]
MIILKIKNNAGPGNQMFMYSRAYALAKEFNQKVLIISEISGYSVRQNILHKFKLDKTIIIGFVKLDWLKNQYLFRLFRKLIFDVILTLPIFCQIKQPAEESRCKMKNQKLKKGKIYVLDGYWECHEYFDKYREDLISQFVPKYVLSDSVKNVINEMQHCNSVSVHIRKGDFKEFGRLIDDSYYDNAMKQVEREEERPVFYILTEDIGTENYYRNKGNFKIINFDTPNKYIDEWFVMTYCKHHIIANSTYSWWFSYVSNKKERRIIPNLEWYLQVEKNNNEGMYKNYYLEDDEIMKNY